MPVYELYFKNIYSGDKSLIGTYLSEQDAREMMVKEITKKGFKPYYYRMWEQEPGVNMIDFGSHSEFYMIRTVKQ